MASQPPDQHAVALKLRALVMDPVSHMPVVVLQREDQSAFLPIWIGLCEANAIALQMEGVSSPRPMTHDLLLSLIQSLDYSLEHVLIHTLQDNVFFARLHLRANGGRTVEVDARPSDAVALALRASAPILATDEVLRVAETTATDDEETLRTILRRL
ncbi:MAG: bifunctional nuclease family protein, partial [Acidobacteria bacterium]|nr:bifunctional nuclease family protein [Acidobacteriota bacterium]